MKINLIISTIFAIFFMVLSSFFIRTNNVYAQTCSGTSFIGQQICELDYSYDPPQLVCTCDYGQAGTGQPCVLSYSGYSCVNAWASSPCHVASPPCSYSGPTPPPATPTPSPGGSPTPTPTPTTSPPPLTPKPGVAFIIYNDASGDGVWNASTENRITPVACSAPYTSVMSGFGITVINHANSEDWLCNVGTSETNEGCTGDNDSCGGSSCGRTAGSGDGVFNSCLDEKTCYEGGCACNPPYVGCPGERCRGDDTTYGALCRTNMAYCTDSNPANLRVGPYFKAHHTVGAGEVRVTFPAGWTMSNTNKASIGSMTDFVCSGQTCIGYVDFQTNGTAGGGFACMGTLIKFGAKRQPLPAPTNLTAVCSESVSQATFSWDSVAGADGYILRINHDDQCYAADGVTLVPWACTATSNCNASYGYGVCADQFLATKGNANCSVVGSRTQCTVSIRQGETYPDWSVQPILPGESYPYISSVGVGTSFMCQAYGSVVGAVYNDTVGSATATVNNCTGPITDPMSGVSISLSANGTQTTGANGLATFTQVADGPPTNPVYTMTLNGATLPSGYTLVCPQSGSFTVNSSIIPNTTNPLNFFVTQMRAAWFQLRNGNARSESGVNPAVKSVIPSSCTAPGCNPYVFTMNSAIAATDGYAVTGVNGMINTSETAGTPLANIRETDKVYAQSGRTAIKEGYDYFYRQFSMGTNPQDDFPAESISQLSLFDILDGFVTPKDNRTAYYISSTAGITQPWNVPSGENIVIFVNGDLNIRNTIRVAQGGFLAFIVRGNVNVDVSVGSSDPTSTTSVVEGVYIADGMFRTCTNKNATCGNAVQNISDLKFVGAGTFVGWGGVALQRDFSDSALGGIANNRNPAELFYSRPDFMLYTPQEMKKPHYLWQEVNP